jgi:hypothetical protein
MELIAFNGFCYSIKKWLPSTAREVWRWNWTKNKALAFAEGQVSPFVGVGFSDGATAMSHVAGRSSLITDVFLHSPLFEKPQINRGCFYRLYSTVGDTTPTADGTLDLFDYLADNGAHVTLTYLRFESFVTPTLMERFLASRKHIFHNLVPQLMTSKPTRDFWKGI